MEVAIIGGAGTVGSTTAYTLAVERPDVDVKLVDIAEEAAAGHAIDIRHARTLSQLPQFTGKGTVNVVDATASETDSLSTADIAVVAASVPRPTGAAKRGGRSRFLDRNRELATTVASMLANRDPMPTIVVTNPVDQITYRLWQETGWQRGYFLGYTLSETARAADKISEICAVSASSVYCPIVGEHGEHVVPLFSRLTVDREPITLTEQERKEVREYVRNVPYDVINLRGQAETSRWVSGHGVARLTQAVLDGGLDSDPIALSVPLDGEYGFTDVCLSVPVRFGRAGIEQVLEWHLNDEERERLIAAYESLKTNR